SLGRGRTRERAPQWGWTPRASDLRPGLLGAGFFYTRPLRSGACKHSRQSVAAIGRAYDASSCAVSACDPVRDVDASGALRARRIPRARTCSCETPQDRGLEQPAAASCPLTEGLFLGFTVFGHVDSLALAQRAPDARFAKTIQDLHDNAT